MLALASVMAATSLKCSDICRTQSRARHERQQPNRDPGRATEEGRENYTTAVVVGQAVGRARKNARILQEKYRETSALGLPMEPRPTETNISRLLLRLVKQDIHFTDKNDWGSPAPSPSGCMGVVACPLRPVQPLPQNIIFLFFT